MADLFGCVTVHGFDLGTDKNRFTLGIGAPNHVGNIGHQRSVLLLALPQAFFSAPLPADIVRYAGSSCWRALVVHDRRYAERNVNRSAVVSEADRLKIRDSPPRPDFRQDLLQFVPAVQR